MGLKRFNDDVEFVVFDVGEGLRYRILSCDWFVCAPSLVRDWLLLFPAPVLRRVDDGAADQRSLEEEVSRLSPDADRRRASSFSLTNPNALRRPPDRSPVDTDLSLAPEEALRKEIVEEDFTGVLP